MLAKKLRPSYLYLICAIISILLVIGYSMDYSGNISSMIKNYDTLTFILMMVGCYCINILLSKISICKKELFFSLLLGTLFTIFEFIGVTMESGASISFMFSRTSTIIKAIAFICTRVYLFTAVTILLFNRLKVVSIHPPIKKISILSKLTFPKLWGIIFLFWLPYCIFAYPGHFGGGSQNQVLQFYGIDTLARHLSNIMYDGYYITAHHPVALTIFYGIFFKLGELLGHISYGFFLLSLVTQLLISSAFAYIINTIRKYLPDIIWGSVFILVCVFPLYGEYSFVVCKDNLYSAALLIYCAQILQIIYSSGKILENRKFIGGFFIESILIPFLKNQGIYIVIFVLFILTCTLKKQYRRKMIFNIVSTIFLYQILFVSILMPQLKIAPGGKQEALSIPFQQTAYYVLKYKSELTDEEYHIINRILPLEELEELYIPDYADNVKFSFKQDATTEELGDYFKLYFKQLVKHPSAYFISFLRMTDGYYYLEYDVENKASLAAWDYLYTKNTIDTLMDDTSPAFLRQIDELIDVFLMYFRIIPLIGMMFNVAGISWIMLFICTFILTYKNKNRIIIMLPMILTFAVCLLSPVNGCYRYIMPTLYGFPIMLCLLFDPKANV